MSTAAVVRQRFPRAAANVNNRKELYLRIARAATKGNHFAWWWLFAYPPLAGEPFYSRTTHYIGRVAGLVTWLLTFLFLCRLVGFWGPQGWSGWTIGWGWVPAMFAIPFYGVGRYVVRSCDTAGYNAFEFREMKKLMDQASCTNAGQASAQSLGTTQAQCLFYIQETLTQLEQARAQASMPATTSGVHGKARRATAKEVGDLARGGS